MCSCKTVFQSWASPHIVAVSAWCLDVVRKVGVNIGVSGSYSYSSLVSSIQGGHSLVEDWLSEAPGESLKVMWWVTV